jgi:general secretion pathway protein K
VSAANQANELRAGFLARSAVNIGLGLLAADARAKLKSQIQAQSQTPGDGQTQVQIPCESFNDVWAAPFPPMPLEGGNVSLTIVDEARKLNLNSMVSQQGPKQQAILKMQRLFSILDVNADLVQGIIEWITPGGANAPGGRSGDFYLGLKPPYQPRYGPMPTIGDLQMVQGFNEAIFNRVSPFLTVMPETAVNANTASPQVLASLEPELMEDQKLVQEIIESRGIRPFTQPTDIMNLPGFEQVGQRLSRDVQLRSQFFTIAGTGTYAGARKIITATFHREANGIGTMAAWHED